MIAQLAPALRMMFVLTVLTGFIYPGVVTGLCQLLFRNQANGSLVSLNGQVVGSKLLGQNFAAPKYFHPRPSAAGTDGYDATSSNGSNLGPTSQKLFDRVKTSAQQFRKENPAYSGPIPADALTASGSGRDPDISVANAQAQLMRVAKARGVSEDELRRTLASNTGKRGLGFLGEPRVNVLQVNLALDKDFSKR